MSRQLATFKGLLSETHKEPIFFVGNGGSASTASHFTSDLSAGMNLKPFRAISLTDNNSTLTALANDFGYQNVFVKQLEALYRKDDLLVAISASGNSPNILRAVEYVKRLQGITIGLTGFNGGKLLTASDYCVIVPTDQGEYGFVEDVHLIINHIVATYFRRYN